MATAHGRATALIVALLLVSIGCQPTVVPTRSPAASPSAGSPTPAPTVLPTVSPMPAVATVSPLRPTPSLPGTPDQDSMPTSAAVERHGIRLTIRLGTNPLYAGNEAVAFVTVKNTGRRLLRWTNDGCDTNAGVHGISMVSWRDSDLPVPPDLAPFRDWLREEANVDGPAWLAFRRGFAAMGRSSGCADLGIPKELAPGRAVTQEFFWDGTAAPRHGPPPTGPAKLTAVFDHWTRPGPGPEGEPIEVTLDSWVLDGRDEAFLSPAEAIDAALADKRFASWLVTRPLRARAAAIAEYDPDVGLWAVGLLMDQEAGDPVLHAAFLDPVTGEVITIREHRVEY
jgi:hypothetical protein